MPDPTPQTPPTLAPAPPLTATPAPGAAPRPGPVPRPGVVPGPGAAFAGPVPGVVPVAGAGLRPGPAGAGFVEETGVAAVDEALARLEGLAEVAAEGHAELFESVHEQLRQTLASLDQPHP